MSLIEDFRASDMAYSVRLMEYICMYTGKYNYANK